MQCLNEVYLKIKNAGIELFDFKIKNYDAATIKYGETYGIFADFCEFSDLKSEFIAMAHEYGHCISGTTHKIYSPYELIEQHENRANRAAVHEFLPYEMLLEALNNGNGELWQIAEYLDMPERFVEQAIELYKTEGKL